MQCVTSSRKIKIQDHFHLFVFLFKQEVCQIELLCKQLYESQDAIIREQAEKAVVAFQVQVMFCYGLDTCCGLTIEVVNHQTLAR